MTVFDTYGTDTYTARQLADLLTERLAVDFTERESSYLGYYFLATLTDTTSLQVQPNAVPGDDSEDDLYMDQHPDVAVLLLVTAPNCDQSYEADLSLIEGLTRLESTES
jgi:hypothetical protein